MRLPSFLVTFAASAATASPLTPRAIDSKLISSTNDFSCRSTKYPNPVIALHGLFATANSDLNFLEAWLRPQGFCTFSLTYGQYPLIPLGGLKAVSESSVEIADFIKNVLDKTGAPKVDIVGHSEGGLQSLYLPKFAAIADRVDKIIAIAPPTHGTDSSGLVALADTLGIRPLVNEVLDKIGCDACNDMIPGGPAVMKLNSGAVVQPGNKVTVIASRNDRTVVPPSSAFVKETGVSNIFVQDYCPLDLVGHVSLAIDLNVWNLVLNSLENRIGRKFPCVISFPF
ncbi:unnamed protein product [Clonostachys byssicola]|uniref:AB hydrolase-1 domain-containing protein n=1 Tax=Clonostachys byssicola TaxID=160290 RepID=A0A9N9UIC7_9HYPO|nr:unnamed protein product [Clonostachys byssicola]